MIPMNLISDIHLKEMPRISVINVIKKRNFQNSLCMVLSVKVHLIAGYAIGERPWFAIPNSKDLCEPCRKNMKYSPGIARQQPDASIISQLPTR